MSIAAGNLMRYWHWMCPAVVLAASLWLLPQAEAQSPNSLDEDSTEQSPPSETDTGDGDASTAAPSPTPSVRLGPDTYLVPDADGNLQPVLNLSYEELLAALENGPGAANPAISSTAPQYVLNSLKITGQIDDGHVAVTSEYEIRLESGDMTEVPLGFLGASLEEEPQLDDSLQGIHYDAARGGYVARCQSEADETVRVVLKPIVPLRRTESGTTLQTNLPRALTSNLVLVAGDRLESVEANDGVVLNTQLVAGGATRIEAVGGAGELRISWRPLATDSELPELRLTAAGSMRAVIDGRGIRCETKLLVQSFGSSFSNFKIRLPRDTTLVRHEGQLVDEVLRDEPGEEGGDANQGELWRVELTEEADVVPLTLVTDQPLGLSLDDVGATIELRGIEVVDAVRQVGQVALIVDDDYQLWWDNSNNVQQVGIDQLDDDLLQNDVMAAFAYFRQPWSLRMRLLRRDLRVVATPQYRLEIAPNESPDQARLRITVNYSISGGAVAPILFNANGWVPTSDPVASTGLANADSIEFFRDGTFGLPSTRLESPPYQVSFWVSRDLSAAELTGRQRFQARLPSLVDAAGLTIATSELTVTGGDALELTPLTSQMPGLIPQPRELESAVGTGQLDAQRFDFRGIQPELEFAATLRPRPGVILVDEFVQLRIADEEIEIEQWLNYDVRFQPADSLLFELPKDWNSVDSPEFELHVAGDLTNDDVPLSEGLPLEVEAVPESRVVMAREQRLKVALGHSQIGRFRIRVRYSLPAARPSEAGGLRSLTAVLLAPIKAKQSRQLLKLANDGVARWSPVPADNGSSSWVPDAPGTDASADIYSALVPQRVVKLIETDADSPTPGETYVDRQWVQTWVAPEAQQQRVVFRVRSSESMIRIELPQSVAAEQVEVTLNGSVVSGQTTNRGQITVSLPASERIEPHTVELRYQQKTAMSAWSSQRVELPRVFGDDSWVKTFWQVIVPANHVLVDHPSELSPAFRWRSDWITWQPLAALDSKQLEEWVGAHSRTTHDTGESSYLLYTHLGEVAVLEATLVAKSWLVLITAGAVLGVFVALLYAPRTRQPGFLLAIIVVMGVVSLAYPRLTAVVGHTVILGGLLGMIAWCLKLALHRSQPAPPAASRGGSSLMATSGGDSYPPLSVGSVASTNAPTVSMPASE